MVCGHTPCGCEVGPDDEFCGIECARAELEHHAVSDPDRCRCEHPECRPDNARLYDPAEADGPLQPADVSNPPVIEKE